MERLRMCIVCRQMYDKRDLLRIVKDKDGAIFIDQTGKKNGRGAYICRNEECAKKLVKQKALNKAFKCDVDNSVYQSLQEGILGKRENWKLFKYLS